MALATVTVTATDREGHPTQTTAGYSTPGPAAGVTLTPHSGDMTVTVPGTVLDGLDIAGRVSVTTTDVTIRNCRVRGNSTLATNAGLINATNINVQRLIIQDCLLNPDVPSLWWNGVTGHDFTVQRCNIYGTVDGVGVFNTANSGGPVNVKILGNWIHDLAYFSPDPNHTGDTPVSHTHNDCIQIQAGTNIEIGWNVLAGFCSPTYGPDISRDQAHPNSGGGFSTHYPYLQASSAVQVNLRSGFIPGGLNIHDNLIDGGAFSINTDAATYPDFGSIRNNRFGDNQRPDSPAYISVPAAVFNTGLVTGNTHQASGLPVPVRTF